MDHWTGSARALSGTRERSCGSEVGPESRSLLWPLQVSHTERGAEVCDLGSVGADPCEVSYCRSTSCAQSGRPRDRTEHEDAHLRALAIRWLPHRTAMRYTRESSSYP